MSNELMIQEAQTMDCVVKDIDAMQEVCRKLMQTKHYAAMGEAGLFAIVQKARALGINPLEALNGGLYFVQGRVGMSSEMMASLIRGRGHSIIKDDRSDHTVCILRGKRADNGDTWTVSFSIDDAKRAGLARGMYDKYPAIMLYNRAMSIMARQLFPDVIKGSGYTREELIEAQRGDGRDLVREEVEEEPVKQIITQEQAQELIDILSDCTEEYQQQLMSFIRRSPINAKTIGDLPVGLYDRVKAAAIKKREENMRVCDEEVFEMAEKIQSQAEEVM